MSLTVEFYYGLGSRYSYLPSTQLERIAAETGSLRLASAQERLLPPVAQPGSRSP